MKINKSLSSFLGSNKKKNQEQSNQKNRQNNQTGEDFATILNKEVIQEIYTIVYDKTSTDEELKEFAKQEYLSNKSLEEYQYILDKEKLVKDLYTLIEKGEENARSYTAFREDYRNRTIDKCRDLYNQAKEEERRGRGLSDETKRGEQNKRRIIETGFRVSGLIKTEESDIKETSKEALEKDIANLELKELEKKLEENRNKIDNKENRLSKLLKQNNTTKDIGETSPTINNQTSKKLNIDNIKDIPIQNLLTSLGYSFTKETPKELWYKSPFRDENTPSFKVNKDINKWYDFGIGKGGNTFDLAQQIFNTTPKDTIAKLNDMFNYTYEPIQIKHTNKDYIKEENPLKIKDVKDITNPLLIEYLKERDININVAKKYLKEVSYTNTKDNKEYFALGSKNDSGSYEVRNKLFKGFVGDKKDITTIKRSKSNLLIFEGSMDYLSYLSHYKISNDKASVLILNSTALSKKAIDYIKTKEFKNVYGFLDNDNTGNKATDIFKKDISNFTDKRDILKGAKDFNEFLSNSKKETTKKRDKGRGL